LVRINNDGSFDTSFDAGTAAPNGTVTGMFNQADDRLLVFGIFTEFGGTPASGIVRLTHTGARDSSFGPPTLDEYGAPGTVNGVAQQADGKLLVGGLFHSAGGVVAHNVLRLASDGTRDPSFDSSIAAGPSGLRISAFAIRPADGHIFVGGYFSSYGGTPRNNMAWIGPNGSVDATFAGLGGATDNNPQVFSIAVQPDGKILAAGLFSSFNSAPRYNLVRLNPDATIDPSFDPNLQTEGSLRAVVVQPDGKILIGGVLRAVNGIACGKVARLNPDGTLDTSFNVGSGANNTVQAIAVDPAGNIFVGGLFTSFAGTARRGVVKLSPTGALDPGFNSGAGTNSTVFAFGPANDPAGILVGGSFTDYNGVAARYLIRLNATSGARDLSFNSGGSGPSSTVRAIAQQADGKVYLGGSFSSYNGVGAARVVRLNVDGTRDASFSAAPNTPFTVHALALQGDKPLVAGTYPVSPSSPALRLLSNGSIDPSFGVGFGAAIAPRNAYYTVNSSITALAIQPDGKALAGGIFNQYDGTPRVALARLIEPRLAIHAASRKTHGQAGAFELALPFVGNPAIEDRSGGTGSNHEIVLTFAGPVAVGGASVSSGSGTVTGVTTNGKTAVISLAGVSNAQTVALTLSGLISGSGATPAALRLPIGFLLGDTNADGIVNSGDSIQARSRAGQETTSLNFRSDVNADGVINGGDTIVVRSRAGSSLP
jgi:uncharacterized delta-60 repeat protein